MKIVPHDWVVLEEKRGVGLLKVEKIFIWKSNIWLGSFGKNRCGIQYSNLKKKES